MQTQNLQTYDDDVLGKVKEWRGAGRKVALATVVLTWGSSPRPVGSQMAVGPDGSMVGSVSGGCIEGAVVKEALDAVQHGAVARRRGHTRQLPRGLLLAARRLPRHCLRSRQPRGAHLAGELRGIAAVERLARFSHGFYRYGETAGELRSTDLRMGQEPHYLFTFTVARREAGRVVAVPPVQVGLRPDLRRGLTWLWRRASGEPIPPLR